IVGVAFGLVNQIYVAAIGHECPAGEGLLKDFLVSRIRLFHFSPLRAGNIPIPDIRVHWRFFFSRRHLRGCRRDQDGRDCERAQPCKNPPQLPIHHLHPPLFGLTPFVRQEKLSRRRAQFSPAQRVTLNANCNSMQNLRNPHKWPWEGKICTKPLTCKLDPYPELPPRCYFVFGSEERLCV